MRVVFSIGLIFFINLISNIAMADFDKVAAHQNMHRRRSEVIVLDAGHGGGDFGTMSKDHRYEEKDLTLSMTLSLQNSLRRLGYRPVLTRNSDVFITLAKRAAIANSIKAYIFVSIHCNHSENPKASGTEIYYYNRGDEDRAFFSETLGKYVLKAMENVGIIRSRGVKAGNFSVIRETLMPSILVETGFLSNPEERAKLLDPGYRNRLAQGIADGIHGFVIERERKKQKRKSTMSEKKFPEPKKAQVGGEQNRPRRDSNTWPAA